MALELSEIQYDRDGDGKTIRILKRYSNASFIFLLLFAASLLTAGVVMIGTANGMPPQKFLRSLQFMALGVAAIGVGLYLPAKMLLRFIQGKGRFFIIADAAGLHFYFYDALSTIPWADVEGFSLAPSPIQSLTSPLLVAQLKNEDRYRRLINPNSPVSSKLPFATLETSGTGRDMQQLRDALIEMKSQVAPG